MIDIICVRGAGDKEGPEIQDPLIASEFIAKQRGKAFIDANWYKVRSRKIQTPYKDDIYVNSEATITEGNLGITGVHLITSIQIDISTKGITTVLEVEKHENGEDI
jgi:hypothetical protein